MKNKDFFISQNEIAENFGVNRTTVRAWAKSGLPYLEADRGKPGMYHLGHVFWWVTGKRRFEELDYPDKTTALEKMMLARIINAEEFGREPESEEKFDNSLEIYGWTPEDIKAVRSKMLGFLRGWRHAVSVRRGSVPARNKHD